MTHALHRLLPRMYPLVAAAATAAAIFGAPSHADARTPRQGGRDERASPSVRVVAPTSFISRAARSDAEPAPGSAAPTVAPDVPGIFALCHHGAA